MYVNQNVIALRMTANIKQNSLIFNISFFN